MFMLKSTHNREIHQVRLSHVERLIRVESLLTTAENKNAHLRAKLRAYEKAHKPVKNKTGQWIDGKTGHYVKSPAKQNMEAQLRKEADYAYKRVRA